MLSRKNLHEYQLNAISYAISHKRCGLILEMGLGKTISTLTIISDLLDACAVSRVLIIAPLRVANSVWAQEAQNWDHTCHLNIEVCTGSPSKRTRSLATAEVCVINRENVPWLVKLYGKKWPFDYVVIDESSSFKNSSSQRFKALKKVQPYITHTTLLTGTPSPNGIIDLWSQMYLIDGGDTLGKTMSGFKARFFNQTGYMGYTLEPKRGACDQVHELMKSSCLSMTAADYLELPARIDLVQYITLPKQTKKDYDYFERSLLIEFQNGDELEADNAAVAANKLLQWCNGAVYTEDGYTETHKEKLDALADIEADNAGENMLVAYSYKSDLERLQQKFPHAVLLDKQQSTIDTWNKGDTAMLLCHPASAGHGLNLQHGGSLIVWFGIPWSLELYQQFNARLHRQGQSKPVRVVHIVARECIDERVMSVLSQKGLNQNSLINTLKIHGV